MRKEAETRLEPIEDEVAALEHRVRELEQLQADPRTYSDPVKARYVARDKAECQSRLEELYDQWERLAAELPEA